jgi:hypothetical protein
MTAEHHRQEYHREDKREVQQPENVDSADVLTRHGKSLAPGPGSAGLFPAVSAPGLWRSMAGAVSPQLAD